MNDISTKEIPQERTTVYGPQDKMRRLKAKLALRGLGISEWFRIKMDEELADKTFPSASY